MSTETSVFVLRRIVSHPPYKPGQKITIDLQHISAIYTEEEVAEASDLLPVLAREQGGGAMRLQEVGENMWIVGGYFVEQIPLNTLRPAPLTVV